MSCIGARTKKIIDAAVSGVRCTDREQGLDDGVWHLEIL